MFSSLTPRDIKLQSTFLLVHLKIKISTEILNSYTKTWLPNSLISCFTKPFCYKLACFDRLKSIRDNINKISKGYIERKREKEKKGEEERGGRTGGGRGGWE